MTEKTKQVQLLSVAEIFAENRVRQVNHTVVEELAEDILSDGLRQPIEVRRVRKRIELISGAHRLAAFRFLERDQIPAFVIQCNDDEAELREVNENLVRKELNPLDRAMFLFKKKAVYERMNPETKRGVAGALVTNGGANEKLSFTASSAEAMDCSVRKVELMIAFAESISAEEYAELSTSPYKTKPGDLVALHKVTDPDQRAKVIYSLVDGKAKNAKAAIAQLSDKTETEKDPFKEGLKALKKAWKAAPVAAKREFLASQSDLRELLDGDAE